jgi:hypothetical protein
MKTVKVKLAFPSEKPVNFKFGEVNIRIATKASLIEKLYADLIMKQYPGWIEQVVATPRKPKVPKQEVG